MDKRLKRLLKNTKIGRTSVLTVLFCILSFVLINRLYNLQIIDGARYRENFSLQTTKTRTLKASRGSIFDRNGIVLATNELSYSLTIEDSGTYPSYREKALCLNGEAYRINRILESHGDSLDNDFHVVLDENGEYAFNVTGRSLERFRADVYGHAKIADLTPTEAGSTADEMMAYLQSEERFAIVREKKPYTAEEMTAHGMPAELSKQDILNIMYVRYQLFTTSYRKYLPVTIATSLSNESVADLTENMDSLTGIDIVDDTVRIYNNPECFASLIGYTGKVSSEELSELQAVNSNYSSTSIVGKSGIEKVMETTLQGFDGQETVYVDNLGKVLKINESQTIQPTAGNNVYLTIDSGLQYATYRILEQRIAGVLESVIINTKEFDVSEVEDQADIRIPIYDVYEAIIANNVLDITRLENVGASEYELELAAQFNAKQDEVFTELNNELTGNSPKPYRDLSDEMKEYESYIVNDLLMSQTKILNSTLIDRTDTTYLAWTRDETISLREYLTYAASRNWIDVSVFTNDDTYLNSSEIYTQLSAYIQRYLSTDRDFSKMLYKYLLKEDRIYGRLLINVLYDQGVFDKDDGKYEDFTSGAIDPFSLIIAKIHDLVLTPAMLALDPCSGSAVITDPKTGEILACVTYPGYDNNRLANTMDVSYYNLLAEDKSRPFYNKATQQTTAPGSTFKLVTTTAGLEENAISLDTIFECNGRFDLIETPLNCWFKTGHGILNVIGGLQNSCNVFFSNVAYQLGINAEGNWSDSLSLGKLQKYAEMYNMDVGSGIEIPEASPAVSDQYAVPSAIGQGTHAFTTTQLARYVTTLANSGTSYSLSVIDRVTDADENLIEEYTPSVLSTLNLSDTTWYAIHEGMLSVVNAKEEFNDLPLSVAGKTGTAEESKTKPSHAMFITYAPYEDPQLAMAIRIGNGYSSTNAMLVGKDIYQYYFGLADPATIITGTARTESVSQAQTD